MLSRLSILLRAQHAGQTDFSQHTHLINQQHSLLFVPLTLISQDNFC